MPSPNYDRALCGIARLLFKSNDWESWRVLVVVVVVVVQLPLFNNIPIFQYTNLLHYTEGSVSLSAFFFALST